MINSRNIDDLLPEVADKTKEFIAKCAEQGIDVLITSTYRDIESQNALYAQGRTAPGPIVTNAKGDQSFHNWRVAFDFVPLVNGKAQWKDLALFSKCGQIGESLGFEWAGRWKKFPESAHLQMTNGKTINDFNG